MADNEVTDMDIGRSASESSSCREASENEGPSTRAQPQRISLGSLLSSEPCRPTHADRVVSQGSGKRKFSERGATCRGGANEDTSAEGTGVRWFKGSHIPADSREVLDWHPNRVRAMFITEIHERLQHLAPKRLCGKVFGPISQLHSLLNDDVSMVPKEFGHQQRTTAKDFYVRALNYMTGDGIRKLKHGTSQAWQNCTNEDKLQWFLLHRIAHHPRIAPILDMPKPGQIFKLQASAAEIQEGRSKRENRTWSGYGFVLSWNTDLGQDDPDVIKLVQRGERGECLYKNMRGLTLYQEAFTDLWEHANKVAMRKKLGTVNIGLEHSAHGDHEARVHFHAFLGPDLRSGVGFGWNPVLSEITSEEVKWTGIYPNIKPTRPQKKSWNQIYQAVATGSYYVAGPKIGLIMQRSTFKPIEDRAVFQILTEKKTQPNTWTNVCDFVFHNVTRTNQNISIDFLFSGQTVGFGMLAT